MSWDGLLEDPQKDLGTPELPRDAAAAAAGSWSLAGPTRAGPFLDVIAIKGGSMNPPARTAYGVKPHRRGNRRAIPSSGRDGRPVPA